MRVFILGGPGSGKTTIAKKIAKLHDMEFFELDKIFYEREKRGYKVSEEADRAEIIKEFIQKDNWISEGVYRQKWMDDILKKCDFVFLLKIPKYVRAWRITTRTLRQMFGFTGYRPASIKTLFNFYKFNNLFEKERYQEISERLKRLKIKPIEVKSLEDIESVLNSR